MSQAEGNKDLKDELVKGKENEDIVGIATLKKSKTMPSADSEAVTDVASIIKKSPLLRKYSDPNAVFGSDNGTASISKRKPLIKKDAEPSANPEADNGAVSIPKRNLLIKKDAESSVDPEADSGSVSIPRRKPPVKKDVESSSDAGTDNGAVSIPRKKPLIKKDTESSADPGADNGAVSIPRRKPLVKKDAEPSANPEADNGAVSIPKRKLLIKKDAESSVDPEADNGSVSIPRRKQLVRKEGEPTTEEISSEPVKIVRKKPLKVVETDKSDVETVGIGKIKDRVSQTKKQVDEKEGKNESNQDDPDATPRPSANLENFEASQLRRPSIWDSFSSMAQPVTKITSSLKNTNLKSKLKSSATEITKKKRKIIVIEQIPNTPPLLAGKSLNIFHPNHPLRNRCAIFFTQEFTLSIINLLIFIQWFFVSIGSFESQHRENYFGEKWTDYIVAVINLVYIPEIIGKIIIYGLIINPPPLNTSEFQMEYSGVDSIGRHKYSFISHKAFLRDTLNAIDFAAVISFWIDFILMFIMPHNRIYVFKMLSILRPMRLLVTLKYVSVIIESLKRSRPILINILFFLFYFFLVFSILGLLLFEGRLGSRCVLSDTEEIAYPPKFCSSHYLNEERTEIQKLNGVTHENLAWSFGYTCAYGFECKFIENPMKGYMSFDNIFSSLLVIYQIATMQKWSRIMYWLMAAKSWSTSVFFLLSVLILNFWLITLFVAVITRMFEKTREDVSKLKVVIKRKNAEFHDASEMEWHFISEEEKLSQEPVIEKWYHQSAFDLVKKSLRSNNGEPNQANQRSIIQIYKSRWERTKKYFYTREWSYFASCVSQIKSLGTFLIFVDLVFKATSVDPDSLLFYLWNAIITVLLAIEIGIRFITKLTMHYHPGFELYSSDWVDLFLAIVTLSICFIPVQVITKAMILNYLIVFSILRSYRLILTITSIRNLLVIVTKSVDTFKTLATFVVLSFFIVVPMGILLMGGTSPKTLKEEHFTFNNFGEATLALIQVFSAEDWGVLMYDYMSYSKDTFSSLFIAIYMVIWSGFSTFVLLNLFIAITMDGFHTAEFEKKTQQVSNYIEKMIRDPNEEDQSEYWIMEKINILKSKINEYKLKRQNKKVAKKDYKYENESARSNSTSIFQRLRYKIKSKFFTKPVKKKHHFGTAESVSSKNTYDITIKSETDTESQFTRVKSQATSTEIERAEPEVIPTKFDFIKKTTNPLVNLCQRLVIPIDTEESIEEEQVARKSNKPYIYFSNFMLIISWLAIIAALIDVPWYELNNGKLWSESFSILDDIFTGIFTIEFLIKTTALGILFGKDSYFRNAWNVVDFFVVVPMWIDLLVKYIAPHVDTNYLNSLRSFRVLRLITSSKKLQQTIYSLFVVGFGGIFNVIVLGVAFTIPYAIYGHLLFGKMLHSCNDKEILGLKSCTGQFIQEELGILIPRAWNNPRLFNFDNFGSSFLILIEILSREKWVEVMQITMGIRGKNLQPEVEDSWFACFYFIGFFLLGSVFVLTMFITIVIENYRNYTGVSLHTANQRRYIDLFKQINQITPSKQPTNVPKSSLLNWCYQTSVKKAIDIFDIFLILLLVVSCMHFFGDNHIYDYILKIAELGILILLFVELPINIFGIGWKNFFGKPWDIIYFSGVVTTFCLRLVWLINSSSQCDYFAKIGQVALFLRLITMNDQLLKLANIMAASIWEILNFLYIWIIIILLYSIAFNQMFGLTRFGHSTDNYANFRYIWTSILLLFRLSTGEFWNDVMHDFAVMSPHCVKGTTYLESDCGNNVLSYILFISFNIISMYIFTNILIVLILDNFSFCYDIAASFNLLSRSEIRDFKTKWRLIDENGTGYLNTADVIPFLKSLESPFETKLFPTNLEIHYLITQSQTEKTIKFSELTHKIDNEEVDENMQNYYHFISKKMNETMDKRYLQLHRRNFNMIYKELVRKERKDLGIPITDVLLTMAHYKIVNPDDSFLIEDLLLHYKDREEILFSYRIELTIGLMKTYIQRKKFLKHLNKQNSGAKEGPTSMSKEASQESSNESVASDPLEYLNSFINDNKFSEADIKNEKFDEEEPERLNTSNWNSMLTDCISTIELIDFPSSPEDSSSDSGSMSDAYIEFEQESSQKNRPEDQAYDSE